MESGLTPEIVEKLSKEKDDPAWMQQFRLESLQIYNEMQDPGLGSRPSRASIWTTSPPMSAPTPKMQNDWKDVPQDIKETFERLRHPAGGAQVAGRRGRAVRFRAGVPQRARTKWRRRAWCIPTWRAHCKGEYADMVRKYFMKLVTPA